jgi:uncharacterized protein DUF4397
MIYNFRLTRMTRLSSVRALAGIGVLAGLTAMAGCTLDNNLTANGGPQGLIQFVNAAPRYRFVNLNIDSANAVPVQGYGSGTSAYVDALANARQLTVKDSANSTTLAAAPLQVANQSVYLVLLTQHSTGGNLLVFPDTASAPPGTAVGLRVINTSPSAGAVDVYITGADSTLATPVATNIGYEGNSGYLYPQNGGVLRLRLTVAGTKTVLLDVDASSLTPGQVRSIILIDATGGGLPASWLAVPDRG